MHYIYYFRLAITCLISILSLLEKRKIFFAFLLLLTSLSLRERFYEPICLYFSCHQSCRSFSHQQIRKEKLQRLLQEQLLKDETFRATIKEKIQTTENINDVIDYINKGYRLGIMISKEIVEDIRK